MIMKTLYRLLVIPFLILGFNIYAQKGDVVQDSVSISMGTDSIYNISRWVKYEGGYQLTSFEPIGDSSNLVSYLVGMQVDKVRQHTYHAVQTMQGPKTISEWQDINANLKRNSLPGLDTLIQSLFEGEILGDVSVKVGSGNFTSGNIVKNNQGNLRLLFSTVGYRIIMYSDTMYRVVGYPQTGQNTDMYKIRQGLFRSLDNTLTVRARRN